VPLTTHGVATERALVLAHTPYRDSPGEIALEGEERTEGQPDSEQREDEGAEVDWVDVVRDVIAGHDEGQDSRGRDNGEREGEIPGAPLAQTVEQHVPGCDVREHEEKAEDDREQRPAVFPLLEGPRFRPEGSPSGGLRLLPRRHGLAPLGLGLVECRLSGPILAFELGIGPALVKGGPVRLASQLEPIARSRGSVSTRVLTFHLAPPPVTATS
jgi:hypothetical protein